VPLTDSESERARARPQARKAEPGRQEACLVSSRLVSSVQCRMPLTQPLAGWCAHSESVGRRLGAGPSCQSEGSH
jgi:hypothetical protein